MGIFGDIGRLMKAGFEQTMNTDYAANLRQSADLAEQTMEAQRSGGTHGAAQANPFVNMSMFQSMIQGNGRVLGLSDSGSRLDDNVIYNVDMEITLPDREPYPTVYRTVIALSALPNWQPGALFPMRVSPDDPHSVMLG